MREPRPEDLRAEATTAVTRTAAERPAAVEGKPRRGGPAAQRATAGAGGTGAHAGAASGEGACGMVIASGGSRSVFLYALPALEPIQIAAGVLVAWAQDECALEGLLRFAIEAELGQRPAKVDPGIGGRGLESDGLAVGEGSIEKAPASDCRPTSGKTRFVVAAGVAPGHGAGEHRRAVVVRGVVRQSLGG